MKAVYITGITGFLGSHLAHALVREGWDVHGLKRSTSSLARLSDLEERITFHDVDRDSPESVLAGAPPAHAIIHLATNYGRAGEKVSSVVGTNLVFPLTLLEAARAHKVAMFLHANTCFTPGYKHFAAYTLSKGQFAAWGHLLGEAGPTQFIDMRLYHPYGPGDAKGKFVPDILRNCLDPAGDVPLTPGEQRKDFIYVDDVVEAFKLVLRSGNRFPPGGATVDVGSGQATSIRAFVEAAHRVTGSTARLRFGALPYRENEIMFSQADTAVLRELGWQPRVPLEEGIRRILREDFGRE